jgi:maleate isomerase
MRWQAAARCYATIDMNGYRARLGFLVPPGNPTTEPEMMMLSVPGVSLHFTRMVAHGITGSLDGQEDRNRTQIAHLDACVALLAMVKPSVIVLAHTATSYTLGRIGEAETIERTERTTGIRFITAFGSVAAALAHLGIQRVAIGTPYNDQATAQCEAHMKTYGLDVVSRGRLKNVTNIYDETPERAYQLGREVDCTDAQAVFLSGVGMPTLATLQALEQDIGKPVISSASAMMWNALRVANVTAVVPGFGHLLATLDSP